MLAMTSVGALSGCADAEAVPGEKGYASGSRDGGHERPGDDASDGETSEDPGEDVGDGDSDVDSDAGGGGGGGGEPKLKPKCVQKDSQVIVIGDSYINWPSHTFPDDIARESGQKWRMQAIGGMSMATGGIGAPLGQYIPSQFDDAIAADPDAHTVLMDGGGNDVLVGWLADPNIEQCKDTGSSKLPRCQQVITDAIAAAEQLMEHMLQAGIRDVVYFFYPHIPEGRPIGGPHPNEILDFALPQVQDFCEGREAATSGALRCHFIDMRPVFVGHDPDWFNTDIHPTSDGSKAMAKEVWSRMTDWCVGQKSGSDCCEP